MTGAAPQPNFDRIARPYRLLEYLTFGPTLHRARTHLLPEVTAQLPAHPHALVLGDGDGRFASTLLSACPHLQADAVDLSPVMLRLLTRRAHVAHPTAPARLRTFPTDALLFTPPPNCRYDLVVTHFFLDCLTPPELHQLTQQLAPHIAPNALWLLSDFRIPATGPLRLPARALVRSLYLGFRILTGLRTRALPDHPSALSSIGFEPAARHLSLHGLLTSELWRRSTLSPLPAPHQHHPRDPVPDPEPASPSLPEPDPGVFHHDPSPPPPPTPNTPS